MTVELLAFVRTGPRRCGVTAGRIGTGVFGAFGVWATEDGGTTETTGDAAATLLYFDSLSSVGAETDDSVQGAMRPRGITAREAFGAGVIPADPVCAWHYSKLGPWTFDEMTCAANWLLTTTSITQAAVARWNGTGYTLQNPYWLDPFTPGESGSDGVTFGASGGWTWGERALALWAWMPQMGRTQLSRVDTTPIPPTGGERVTWGWGGEDIASAEPWNWTSEQWPYFPPIRFPGEKTFVMGGGGFFNVAPAYAVWIACSHVRPVEIPTEEYSPGFFSGYIGDTATIVAGASVWWFGEGALEHYRPMLLAGSWWESSTFEDWNPDGSWFWMGCPNWLPYQTMGAYPKANETGSGADQWTPDAWVPGFPVNVGFPERFGGRGHGQYLFGYGLGGGQTIQDVTADLTHPNVKIDGAMRVPGFEFRVPAALRALIEAWGADGLTVVSSTADVTVRDARRREYRYRSARPAVNYLMRQFHAGSWPWGTGSDWRTNLLGQDVLETGEWYGVQLDQLSDDGTGTESWKRQFHVVNTATDARYAPVNGDNTHVHRSVWQAAVVASGAGTPVTTRVPAWVPRRHPWFPTDNANGPEDVENDPASVKLAHALVGVQYWGTESGTAAHDDAVRQPVAVMKRLPAMLNGEEYATTPAGVLPSPTGELNPDPPFYPHTYVSAEEQAHRDTGFLNYWYDELELGTEPIAGLRNVRYRWLGMAHADPQEEYEDEDNRFFSGVERSVNMVEVVEALLEAEALAGTAKTDVVGNGYTYGHHAYRVHPVLPHDPETAGCTVDGVVVNASPLFATNLPRVADLVAVGNVRTGRQEERIEEIVFQRFSAWEIRNWVMVVVDGDDVEHEVRVRTPWD